MAIDYNAWNFTYTTNYPMTFTVGDKRSSDMITEVNELAAGFIGTVFTVVDGDKVAVADTRAYKTYEKASKTAKRLAVDIVKNGVSSYTE